jgi:hypothetical protein
LKNRLTGLLATPGPTQEAVPPIAGLHQLEPITALSPSVAAFSGDAVDVMLVV